MLQALQHLQLDFCGCEALGDIAELVSGVCALQNLKHLQLGFGEGRLVLDGPVHGLEIPIDQPLLDEIGEHFRGGTLEVGCHGELGIVVIREREQAFHLFTVTFLELLRVLPAFTSHRHPALVFRQVGELFDLAALDEFTHHTMFDG